VLNAFLHNANDSKGQSIAVTGPSNKDEVGVTVIQGSPTADIGGLDIIRMGLIKAIITAYGLPGFMLAEGDVGALGGNANIEEIDSYINQEIRPERLVLENIVEKQFYDNILAIMFHVDDATNIPVKIKFSFNKPKLVTLLTPDMFGVLTQMAQLGLIDESGIRDILGLEEMDKETMSKGEAGGGMPQANKAWETGKSPIQINMWPGEIERMGDKWDTWIIKDEWVGQNDTWNTGTPQAVTDKWATPNQWKISKAGQKLQSANRRGAI
jgi:hypothetical protein